MRQLATDAADPRSICAANVLWERAAASPGHVPLDLLQRLAAPMHEDWYVFAPALAYLRELVLRSPAAAMLVHALAESAEVEAALARSAAFACEGGLYLVFQRVDGVPVLSLAQSPDPGDRRSP